MTNAVGPVFAGGFEQFVVNDESGESYTILFLPDRNNDQLQREGKPPVFYYVPEQVRLAQHGDRKDYKFHHVHFVGVFDEDTSVGIGEGEVQGGVLSLTTTSRYPTAVLQQAQGQLLEKFRGRSDIYWGIRTTVAPDIRIAPIVSNITAITNLSPDASGAVPTATPTPGGGPVPGPRDIIPGARSAPRSREVVYPRQNGLVRTVPHGRNFRAPTALDAWAWRLQGQGPGSVTGGENAYSGLVGAIPSEIIWAGFHGAYSPIVVAQNLLLPMWSQLMRIKITGSWERIFQHFSSHLNARYLWFSADIKAEFNNLRLNGDIKVEVDIDGTAPGADEMEKVIEKRIDTIVQQFTEQAKKVIFEPPMPDVKPAEAPSGGILSSLFGGTAGLALRFRRDTTQVNLEYEETRYFRYLQPHTISSSMKGFFDQIKQDPDAEKKYFTRLVLGGLGRKVHRIIKPVVNWPEPARQWVGEPVAFVSAQVGYPDQQGIIQWKSEIFQSTDPADRTWEPVFVQWRDGEVSNPPRDWDPSQTYVKRKVHLKEPPGESEYPFMKVTVEQNVIDLDRGPNGSLTNDNTLEVRADSAGVLDVGPIALGAELGTAQEVVEVEFRAMGKRADGSERSDKVTRFRWSFTDQNEPRYWRVFTGQLDFVPRYEYQVHVTVRGTLFNKGMAWSGPWTAGAGNGPLMVQVPTPGDPGVQPRSLTPREIASTEAVHVDGVAPPVSMAPSGMGTGAAAPATGAARPGGAMAPRTGRMAGAYGRAAPTPRSEEDEDADRAERTVVEGFEVMPERATSAPASRSRRYRQEEPAESRAQREAPAMVSQEPEGYVPQPAGPES